MKTLRSSGVVPRFHISLCADRGRLCFLSWLPSCMMRASGRARTPSTLHISWMRMANSSGETPSCPFLQVQQTSSACPLRIFSVCEDMIYVNLLQLARSCRSQGVSRRRSGPDGALHLLHLSPPALSFHSSTWSHSGWPGSHTSRGKQPQPSTSWTVCSPSPLTERLETADCSHAGGTWEGRVDLLPVSCDCKSKAHWRYQAWAKCRIPKGTLYVRDLIKKIVSCWW